MSCFLEYLSWATGGVLSPAPPPLPPPLFLVRPALDEMLFPSGPIIDLDGR